MANPTWLLEAARATGYPVIEVVGWETRGHATFADGWPKFVVGHHTGTAESATGDYPTLKIVRDGRSDLPGPLCNFGLGRSGTVYVVAAGVAWHAGTSSYLGATDLNNKSIGIEAESAGGGLWTNAQRDAYPKLVGACLKRMSVGTDHYVSHRTCATPAGRKPDPTGLEDVWMRAQAGAYLAGGGVADYMAQVPQAEWNAVRDAILVAEKPWPGGVTDDKGTPYPPKGYMLRGNVETRQAWLEIQRCRNDVADVRKRLDDIYGALQALANK